jgi:rubrerythrin
MLSHTLVQLEKVGKNELNNEILRLAIIAELDAVNLYEQMAALADNTMVKKLLREIAREEKNHVGEFQTILLKLDKEQEKELANGKKEAEEIVGSL